MARMKRIKTGKNKWKYLTDDWLIVTQTQIKQMKKWYDTKIKWKCKDPTIKQR